MVKRKHGKVHGRHVSQDEHYSRNAIERDFGTSWHLGELSLNWRVSYNENTRTLYARELISPVQNPEYLYLGTFQNIFEVRRLLHEFLMPTNQRFMRLDLLRVRIQTLQLKSPVIRSESE